MLPLRLVVALSIASVLSIRGYRKRSLDKSGAIAAFFVGFLSMASGYRFGILLLAFYFSGSKLTKIKQEVKILLEDDFKVNGQRTATQVLSCSAIAVVISTVYYFYFPNETNAPINFPNHPFRSYLLCSYVGHFACCAADTWASELGVLSSKEPFLVSLTFPWKRVPRGTNGGVSLLGTLASAAGGGFIGLLFYLYGCIFSDTLDAQYSQHYIILLGVFSGVFGSFLDSVLGATVQSTWYDFERKKITGKSRNSIHICGYNLLTNEQVNIASVLLTTIVSGYFAKLIM